MKQKKIIKLTLEGVSNAMKTYQKWTGGDSLWEAPEYLITVEIAKSIGTEKFLETGYITLEANVEKSLNLAKAKGTSSQVSRKKGRYDILLWGKNHGRPRAIIEVKNRVKRLSNGLKKDIKRVIESLKRKKSKSTIEFGLITFYTDNQYEKIDLEERLEKLKNNLVKVIDDEIEYDMFFNIEGDDDGKDFWASVVILLKYNR